MEVSVYLLKWEEGESVVLAPMPRVAKINKSYYEADNRN